MIPTPPSVSKDCWWKKLTFISLIMFYDHTNKIMFNVLGYIICKNFDNFICLNYPCLVQNTLSKNKNPLAAQDLIICLGFKFLIFWWILWFVMVLRSKKSLHWYLHSVVHLLHFISLNGFGLFKQNMVLYIVHLFHLSL